MNGINVAVATMVCVVKGDDESCKLEALSVLCDNCNQACVAKHPGGEGACQMLGGISSCICYYDCPPPSPPGPKFCQGGAGVCSLSYCWNDCCNTKCAGKYTNGTGFCTSDIGSTALCQCQYPCNS